MISQGVPAARADMMLGLFVARRKRECARVDPTLEKLLGRPPMYMREVLAARLSKTR